jgi:hypothetical protein
LVLEKVSTAFSTLPEVSMMYGTGYDCEIRPSPCIYLRPKVEAELWKITDEFEDQSVLEYFPKDRESKE